MFGFLKRIFAGEPQNRGYQDMAGDATLSAWRDDGESDPNRRVRDYLEYFRRKARDMAETNPYIGSYLKLRRANVIGPDGFKFQSSLKNKNDRENLEALLREWKEPEHCTTGGRNHHNDEDRMQETALATDGETFIRVFPGYRNKFRFAIRTIEADHIDEDFNSDGARGTGNRIISGKEINSDGRCVAYWMDSKHPGADCWYVDGKSRYRIPDLSEYIDGDTVKKVSPVGYMVHHYEASRPGQVRGFPELASVLSPLRKLERTVEAHHDAARLSACTIYQEVDTYSDMEMPPPEGAKQGRLIAKPASIAKPAAGKKWEVLNAPAPNTALPDHVDCTLKEVSAALAVASPSLSGNLEGTSFSSGRTGARVEQANWLIKQDSTIKGRERPIFYALIRAQIQFRPIESGLDPNREFEYRRGRFQGVRWPYINPIQDMAAHEKALELRVTSPQRVIIERGGDPEEIAKEWEEWTAMASKGAPVENKSALFLQALEESEENTLPKKPAGKEIAK